MSNVIKCATHVVVDLVCDDPELFEPVIASDKVSLVVLVRPVPGEPVRPLVGKRNVLLVKGVAEFEPLSVKLKCVLLYCYIILHCAKSVVFS